MSDCARLQDFAQSHAEVGLNYLELARGRGDCVREIIDDLCSRASISDRLTSGGQPFNLCGSTTPRASALGRRPSCQMVGGVALAKVRGDLDSVCRISDTPHKATGFAEVPRVFTARLKQALASRLNRIQVGLENWSSLERAAIRSGKIGGKRQFAINAN
jgi:hypothetical protein